MQKLTDMRDIQRRSSFKLRFLLTELYAVSQQEMFWTRLLLYKKLKKMQLVGVLLFLILCVVPTPLCSYQKTGFHFINKLIENKKELS